jgi:hypothetical protein
MARMPQKTKFVDVRASQPTERFFRKPLVLGFQIFSICKLTALSCTSIPVDHMNVPDPSV